MKKINLKYLIICCFGAMTLASCNDLEQAPTDKYTDETFWVSTANAEMVANMAYSQMFGASKMWSDEALSDNYFEGRANTSQRTIRNGFADPALALFRDEWKWAYEGIKTCHVFLENVDKVTKMDPTLREQRKAEIRFIRASIYFRLTNFYGAVPFFTKDISLSEAKTIARTPRADIIAFIHTELDDIMKVLPKRDVQKAADKGRITAGAACALQARVYLYDSNWAKVEEYTDKLMKQQYGTYSLFTKGYGDLFMPENEYNSEVILDYGYSPTLKTWMEMYDRAPLTVGARLNSAAPTQSLVDNYLTLNGKPVSEDPTYDPEDPYVNRDPRMTATVVYHKFVWKKADGSTVVINIKPGDNEGTDTWTGPGSNRTSTGYYTRKYYDPTGTKAFDAGLNIIMIRYADVLLMNAEAKMEQNKLTKADWDATVKPIRARAGFTVAEALDFPASANQAQLREIIRNERRSEFAIEGLRYFDIMRWKAGSKYLNGVVLGAKFQNSNADYITLDNRKFNESRDYLWSLPLSQMDLDPNLKPNNPGYQN